MSAYRESAVYTLAELEAAERDADEAKALTRDAMLRAKLRSDACDDLCKGAAVSAFALLIPSIVDSIGRHFPDVLVRAVPFAFAVMVLTFVLRVHMHARYMAAREAHGAAYRAWGRASERASSERSRAEYGNGGRCGCGVCEADPLGFFGPYRKGGAT